MKRLDTHSPRDDLISTLLLTHLDVLVEEVQLVELLQDVVGLPTLHLLRTHRAQGESGRLQM